MFFIFKKKTNYTECKDLNTYFKMHLYIEEYALRSTFGFSCIILDRFKSLQEFVSRPNEPRDLKSCHRESCSESGLFITCIKQPPMRNFTSSFFFFKNPNPRFLFLSLHNESDSLKYYVSAWVPLTTCKYLVLNEKIFFFANISQTCCGLAFWGYRVQ